MCYCQLFHHIVGSDEIKDQMDTECYTDTENHKSQWAEVRDETYEEFVFKSISKAKVNCEARKEVQTSRYQREKYCEWSSTTTSVIKIMKDTFLWFTNLFMTHLKTTVIIQCCVLTPYSEFIHRRWIYIMKFEIYQSIEVDIL